MVAGIRFATGVAWSPRKGAPVASYREGQIACGLVPMNRAMIASIAGQGWESAT
jgi:hypothetical protein